jgi:hypothetical protein
MPAKVYTDKDADLGIFQNKTLAILGYGSQGHAHALNLKDSGCKVIIGLYPESKSKPVAEQHGFEVVDTAEAVRRADVIMVGLPDMKQADVYLNDILPNLKKGKTLLFSHGLSIHFGLIKLHKDVDCIMVAPKGPGHMVRRLYAEGKACRLSSPLRRINPRPPRSRRSHGPRASAQPEPAYSRRPSRKRPRPISSVNKRCCAAAPAHWCRLDSKRSSKPVISRRWRTLNVSTS